MRNAIKEFIEPSIDEKKDLWEHSIFVFDTNVLLNLYRYSKDTRLALLNAIKSLKHKIWLPHQVAYEFMKDRYEVIFDTIDRYDILMKQSTIFINQIKDSLRLKEGDSSLSQLTDIIREWIQNRKEEDLLVTNPSEDTVLNSILDLFDNKVGRKFSNDELNNIYSEGKMRYSKLIPPGYKDDDKNKKAENTGYGDLILWKQILEFAAHEKKSIIFVTHDQKEDWWNIVKGKTIGPRIELRREFQNQTGQSIIFYSMNSFLEYINSIGNQSISQNVFNEVQQFIEKDEIKIDENIKYEYMKANEIIREINRINMQIEKRERYLDAAMKSYNKSKNKNPSTKLTITNTRKKITEYANQRNNLLEKLRIEEEYYKGRG